MKQVFFVFLFAFGFLPVIFGQIIQEDPDIQRAMEIYMQANADKTECEGWRIQVLATTNRRNMESVKSVFQRKMPHYRVLWTYKEPYYYVKAGAFVTKLEALHALEEIKRKFSGAYIVKDKIACSKLL